ncbi:uncharacterized protein PFL1_02640 [Pseudozyma flocculosa PF-1]|uniref:Mannose-6-phosphate isomerase n=2 Tax=Pseudozyma flocculosa TaxID=84751 RepID=A0A5C3EYD9_9BASI|nr:uncharacterized protein PFL1_02640 [Pseudozyma flocculosa PF-1]EPQ29968.1 hypothetical protein PFL1_02640 [Pseudozyma flocculosa PF-1]SPO37283.1 uncharacterized protein PSFLO_02756 [Pseudozyma flocculosa]
MTQPMLFPVHSTVQNMPFGPKGADSLAGQLWDKGGHAQAQGKKLDADTPYAELWMGATHEKGPSTVALPGSPLDGKPLADVLLHDPDRTVSSKLLESHAYLRQAVHGGMPFIFKVLSAGQALPLQAHPDLELARKLKSQTTIESDEHTTFDGHHKPEIALAVTPFRGFVGLAAPPQIRARLRRVPAVAELLHDSNLSDKHLSQVLPKLEHADLYRLIVDDDTEQSQHPSDPDRQGTWAHKLRAAVVRILCADKQLVKKAIEDILSGQQQKIGGDIGDDNDETVDLIRELNGQFPGDVGCLIAPVFMNLAKLQPGECIFAPADTIHAWLSGDIIECMPSSVNVVNSAFGPEPSKETVSLFAQMLSYESKSLDAYMLRPRKVESATRAGAGGGGGGGQATSVHRYDVPFDEFNVLRVQIAPPSPSSSSSSSEAKVELFTGESDDNQVLEGVAVLSCVRGRGKVTGFSTAGGGGGSSSSDEKVESDIDEGKVFVVASGTRVRIQPVQDQSEGQSEKLECYVAYWSAGDKK